MTEEIIRSVWRKRFNAACHFIEYKFPNANEDTDDIAQDDKLKSVNLPTLIQLLLFYLDFVELVVKYNVNIKPPLITAYSTGDIQMEFRKEMLKIKKTPKVVLNFFFTPFEEVIMTYRSLHLKNNIKGKVNITKKGYKSQLELIFVNCGLNLDDSIDKTDKTIKNIE